MGLNKELINLLKKKNEGMVRDFLGREGLKLIVVSNGECEKNIKNLKQIDEVIYTLEFLEREELISVIKNCDHHVIYHVGDCLKNKLENDEIDHLFFTQELLEKNFNNKVKIETKFFDFVDYWFFPFRYKTEKQREKIINFWLPITVAILASALTALLPYLFKLLFSN